MTLTKRQREVLDELRSPTAFLVERFFGHGYMLRRDIGDFGEIVADSTVRVLIRNAYIALEYLGGRVDAFVWRITEAGRKAVAERGDGAEVSH